MERFTRILMVILPLFSLLCGCSSPARYIVVSEDSTESSPAYRENADQRFVCLASADARNHSGLLALRKQSDIQDYERKRTDRQDPVERVLFHLLRQNYSKASEVLHQNEAAFPEYLRVLLNADLAYEELGRDPAKVTQLIKQYQDAYEIQPCAMSRDLINLRIRQVRYLR